MNETCAWVEEDGYWQTNCGHAFELNEGTPSDNDMKFCCYCGRPLAEYFAEEDDAPDEEDSNLSAAEIESLKNPPGTTLGHSDGEPYDTREDR